MAVPKLSTLTLTAILGIKKLFVWNFMGISEKLRECRFQNTPNLSIYMKNWPLWDVFTFPTIFWVCQLTKEEWPKWSLFEQIELRFWGYFCWYLGFFLTFLSDLSAYPYLLSHSYLIMSILISNFGPKYHYLWKLKTAKQRIWLGLVFTS